MTNQTVTVERQVAERRTDLERRAGLGAYVYWRVCVDGRCVGIVDKPGSTWNGWLVTSPTMRPSVRGRSRAAVVKMMLDADLAARTLHELAEVAQ